MRFKALLILLLFSVKSFSQQWKELGPCGSDNYGNHVAAQGGTGQVHCIAFDPDNSSIAYCGSPYGGLWKSKDGGKSWSAGDIDVHQDMEFSSVCDIAFTKSADKKTMWVATGHEGDGGTTGLYISDNEGQTFTPVKLFNDKWHFHFKDDKHISKITAHPKNPDIVFVATSDGLYKTTDAGKTWKLVLTEDELPGSYKFSKGIFSVRFSITDPDNVIYATGKDVYRSVKGGKKGSFKTMTHDCEDMFKGGADCFHNLNFNISVNQDSLKQHDVLYAYGFVAGDTCSEGSKQYMSMFFYNGAGWERRSTVPGTAMGDPIRIKLASVPGYPSMVYAGTLTTFLSADYGKTWKTCTSYDQPGHGDIHAVEIIPGTKDMITGTDGGVFMYHFETGMVEECNNGLCISVVTDMGTSATNPNKIIIGNQDTGSDIWDGTKWTKLPTYGDGYAGQFINAADENNFFTCANFEFFINRTENISLRPSYPCAKTGSACPKAFAQSAIEPNVFYFADKEVYKSEDTAKTWCRISNFAKKEGLFINPSGHFIFTVSPAPSDPKVIYVAFNAFYTCCNSYLLKTDKGGMECSGKCGTPAGDDNWKILTNAPHIETGDGHENFIANSAFHITDVVVSDKDANKLWACYASADMGKITFKLYKSTDGGESWTADEEGLPDYPLNKLAYVKGSNDALFVAAESGVYYKQGKDPWKKYGENLPKVKVVDIEINYKAHKLRAATYGRGIWEIELP
ncbi:MAG: glycosyl hydrolase [Bacteroidota bacterium]|nr:glycosyl hydrolase [Bacteroidota bacterium]